MEEKTSTARVALKYGLLVAVVTMVYSTILYVAGLGSNRMLASLSYVFMIVAIVLAMKEFREKNGGFISYGEGLGLGSLTSAVLGLLSSAFTIFYDPVYRLQYAHAEPGPDARRAGRKRDGRRAD